jgi:hypothetical protein
MRQRTVPSLQAIQIDELLPVPLNGANRSGIRKNQDQWENHDPDGLKIDIDRIVA